jgi:3-(3-hydroxy-phenyl)propionate hydroxylase
VLVTNRTARFLRPADGAERMFRDATIALAKRHAFARALVNTGRMAVANPYGASPLTDTALNESISAQNVALQWADGTPACLNDLLRWAQGHPLLLLFGGAAGDMSPRQLTKLHALLGSTQAARIVQVAPRRTQVAAREAVLDPQSLLMQACGIQRSRAAPACHWALVRPDSYVAAHGSALNTQLAQAIARCIPTPGAGT